jgi:uncharacterized protein CbrC (UPF0167 family)
MEKRALPFFRYHPNPEQTGVIVREEILCEACGKKSEYNYVGSIYCIPEIENLCPWCIKDGTAARKFDAEFQQSIDKSVDNKEAIEELLKRTPGYFSWQGEYWPGHCNDFCAYLGKVDGAGLQKLLSQGDPVLEESVQKEAEQYRLTKEEFLEELNIRIYGYLFQCLTCKGHILHTDLD